MTQASFFSIVFDVQTSRFLNGFVNRFKNKLKPTFPNMALTAVYMGVCGGGGCVCVCEGGVRVRVCVCVCERDTERDRERDEQVIILCMNLQHLYVLY